jgi:hypothetical protein
MAAHNSIPSTRSSSRRNEGNVGVSSVASSSTQQATSSKPTSKKKKDQGNTSALYGFVCHCYDNDDGVLIDVDQRSKARLPKAVIDPEGRDKSDEEGDDLSSGKGKAAAAAHSDSKVEAKEKKTASATPSPPPICGAPPEATELVHPALREEVVATPPPVPRAKAAAAPTHRNTKQSQAAASSSSSSKKGNSGAAAAAAAPPSPVHQVLVIGGGEVKEDAKDKIIRELMANMETKINVMLEARLSTLKRGGNDPRHITHSPSPV